MERRADAQASPTLTSISRPQSPVDTSSSCSTSSSAVGTGSASRPGQLESRAATCMATHAVALHWQLESSAATCMDTHAVAFHWQLESSAAKLLRFTGNWRAAPPTAWARTRLKCELVFCDHIPFL